MKINLFKTDFAEIINTAIRHGYKPAETDPGKILDGACQWLQARGIAEYPQSDCSKIPADIRAMLRL